VDSSRNYYFENPWDLPSLRKSMEGIVHAKIAMPLSTIEISYQAIWKTIVDFYPTPSWSKEEDQFPKPIWT
jgi:hypothetical protein